MTGRDTRGDRPGDQGSGEDRLDRLVRAAAARPVDEAALTRTVLARARGIDRAGQSPRRTAFGWSVPAGAVAAFAIVLVATPFVVAGLPLGRFDPLQGMMIGTILWGGDLAPLFLDAAGDLSGEISG